MVEQDHTEDFSPFDFTIFNEVTDWLNNHAQESTRRFEYCDELCLSISINPQGGKLIKPSRSSYLIDIHV